MKHPVYEPTFLNLDILYKLFEPSAHCSHEIWHQLDHRTHLSANWSQFMLYRTGNSVMHFRRFDPGPTDSQKKHRATCQGMPSLYNRQMKFCMERDTCIPPYAIINPSLITGTDIWLT